MLPDHLDDFNNFIIIMKFTREKENKMTCPRSSMTWSPSAEQNPSAILHYYGVYPGEENIG
jgi:hypothetical protein